MNTALDIIASAIVLSLMLIGAIIFISGTIIASPLLIVIWAIDRVLSEN